MHSTPPLVSDTFPSFRGRPWRGGGYHIYIYLCTVYIYKYMYSCIPTCLYVKFLNLQPKNARRCAFPCLGSGTPCTFGSSEVATGCHGLEEDWLRDTINTMMLDKLMKDSENHVLVFQPLIIDDVRFRQAQRLDKLPFSYPTCSILFFRTYGVGASTIMTCRPMHPGSCEVASKEGASEGCFQEYEE